MKVFGCRCEYELGGRVILVAAKNKLQAYYVAISNDSTRWLFEQTETGGFESDFYHIISGKKWNLYLQT